MRSVSYALSSEARRLSGLPLCRFLLASRSGSLSFTAGAAKHHFIVEENCDRWNAAVLSTGSRKGEISKSRFKIVSDK